MLVTWQKVAFWINIVVPHTRVFLTVNPKLSSAF